MSNLNVIYKCDFKITNSSVIYEFKGHLIQPQVAVTYARMGHKHMWFQISRFCYDEKGVRNPPRRYKSNKNSDLSFVDDIRKRNAAAKEILKFDRYKFSSQLIQSVDVRMYLKNKLFIIPRNRKRRSTYLTRPRSIFQGFKKDLDAIEEKDENSEVSKTEDFLNKNDKLFGYDNGVFENTDDSGNSIVSLIKFLEEYDEKIKAENSKQTAQTLEQNTVENKSEKLLRDYRDRIFYKINLKEEPNTMSQKFDINELDDFKRDNLDVDPLEIKAALKELCPTFA